MLYHKRIALTNKLAMDSSHWLPYLARLVASIFSATKRAMYRSQWFKSQASLMINAIFYDIYIYIYICICTYI